MNRLCILLALSNLMALSVISCSKKSNPPPMIEVIPVKGNPLTFVEGTTLESTKGIPEMLAIDSSQRWMVHSRVFLQEEQANSADKVKTQQPTSAVATESIKTGIETARFKKEYFAADYSIGFFNQKMKINFEQRGGQLFAKSFEGENGSIEVGDHLRILHYSVKGDRAFNILAFLQDSETRLLFSITYVKQVEVSILEQTLNTAYNYLYGPGVSTKWSQKQPLVVTVCKTNQGDYDSLTEQAILKWQAPLAGRLEVKVEHKDSCPPFSDLNTATVRHIKGWIEVLGPAATAAFTANTPDFYQGEFLDSDIMFLVDEWNESLRVEDPEADIYNSRYYNVEALQDIYLLTMIHETGHLLGLGHIFDGTASIMSYEEDRAATLYNYDIESIRELYGQPDIPKAPPEEAKPAGDSEGLKLSPPPPLENDYPGFKKE